MQLLVFILLGSVLQGVLATTANSYGVPSYAVWSGNYNYDGVDGCTGKAIFEPNLKRGDVE